MPPSSGSGLSITLSPDVTSDYDFDGQGESDDLIFLGYSEKPQGHTNPGEEQIKRVKYRGKVYRVGALQAAELNNETIVGISGIISVHEDGEQEAQLYITGPRYRRTKFCGGSLGRKRNEIALTDDSVMVPLKDAVVPRRVIRTNAPYPDHNPARTGDEEQNPLVCRWKMSHKKYRGAVTRLQVQDIPQVGYRWTNPALRRKHRQDHISRHRTGKYTFGDGFCGAGGMSRGAEDAGLQVCWGFDNDEQAIEAYHGNFPQANTYPLDVNSFIGYAGSCYVDVLHISPPCQPHSPAHTVPGSNDDDNEAAGLAIRNLVEKIKPRMVTLEQTYGIVNRTEWFNSYVECFTSLGYSVQWDVLHTSRFGVPQSRKRLIILASGPGEPLACFPEPTHQHYDSMPPNVTLLPPPTVAEAIGDIPPGATYHNIGHVLLPMPQTPKVQWCDQVPTLKTNGLDREWDIHPDGDRRFTPRELACFQTFPLYHTFAGSNTAVKKQIGNAVPPLLAKAILEEVRKALEQADLVMETREIIAVDEDEIDSDDDVVELSSLDIHNLR